MFLYELAIAIFWFSLVSLISVIKFESQGRYTWLGEEKLQRGFQGGEKTYKFRCHHLMSLHNQLNFTVKNCGGGNMMFSASSFSLLFIHAAKVFCHH